MKILYYKCDPIEITPGIAYDSLNEEHYKKMLKDAEVEVITTIEQSEEIKSIVDNSYLDLPVSIVVSFKGELYRSDGLFGSYGTDDWTEWKVVTAKQRTIVVYE